MQSFSNGQHTDFDMQHAVCLKKQKKKSKVNTFNVNFVQNKRKNNKLSLTSEITKSSEENPKKNKKKKIQTSKVDSIISLNADLLRRARNLHRNKINLLANLVIN